MDGLECMIENFEAEQNLRGWKWKGKTSGPESKLTWSGNADGVRAAHTQRWNVEGRLQATECSGSARNTDDFILGPKRQLSDGARYRSELNRYWCSSIL